MAKKTASKAVAAPLDLGVITPFSAPLSSLFISPSNVRKSDVSESGINELAALIEVQRLLNPLQVTAEMIDGAATGRYGVEAGGRRLRALNLLCQQGKISPDEPISIVLKEAEQATEISLAENFSIEPMHPADEFEAFKAMSDQGQSAESISKKFGISVFHVQRRLKLAGVAPVLLALFRQREMTLEQVTVFASVDDQARQVQVWEGVSEHYRNPSNLKRKLIEDEVLSTDLRVRVVGLENYVVAGGRTRSDLFSDEQDTYLTDIGLLDTLFAKSLDDAAEVVKMEGWSWVDVVPSMDYNTREKYRAQPKTYRDETEQEQSERETLVTEVATLGEKIETMREDDECDWGEVNALENQQEAIEEKTEALKELRVIFDDADKTDAGAIVTVLNGEITIQRGMKHHTKVSEFASKSEKKAQMTDAQKAELVPESLMVNLTSQRTLAIQAAMLDSTKITLAALAHRMTVAAFGRFESSIVKISLTQSRHTLEKNSAALNQSRAAQRIDAETAVWREKLPEQSAEWLQWFIDHDQSVSIAMIVFCTASCVDAVQHTPEQKDDANQIASELNLNMADWWTATPESYLSLVPKRKLMDMVTEIKSAEVAAPMEKMKRAETIAFAEAQEKDSRWLPKVLRRAA